MVEVAQRNAGRSASTSRAASPTPSGCPTTTTASTSSSATRCCITSPTSSWRCARCCACSSPAAGSCSRASRPGYGDYVARRLSRLTWWAATHVTQLPRLRGVAAAAGGARRVLARRRARGGRRPAHVRPARTRAPPRRRAGAVDVRVDDRGAAGVVVRLAGAHLRVRGAARQARHALGELRAAGLAAAVRGRPRARARRSGGALLQRRDHRAEAARPMSASRPVRPRRHAVRLRAGHPRGAAARLRRSTGCRRWIRGHRTRTARAAVLRVTAAARRCRRAAGR